MLALTVFGWSVESELLFIISNLFILVRVAVDLRKKTTGEIEINLDGCLAIWTNPSACLLLCGWWEETGEPEEPVGNQDISLHRQRL